MKFEFLRYYASIWACLEHLDGEKASEILKNLFLLVIEWILNFKCLSIILLLLKYQN